MNYLQPMSDTQLIVVGQIWKSNDGKRTVRISGYHRGWDDCTWVSVDGRRRHGRIYGCYLRNRYTLVNKPAGAPS